MRLTALRENHASRTSKTQARNVGAFCAISTKNCASVLSRCFHRLRAGTLDLKPLQNDVLNTTRFSTSVAIQRERKTSASAEGASRDVFGYAAVICRKNGLLQHYFAKTGPVFADALLYSETRMILLVLPEVQPLEKPLS